MDCDLVLSGSGVRLPAHAGALVALVERGYEIQRVCGVSGGAVVGAAFACMRREISDDLTAAEDIRDLTIETDFKSLVTDGGLQRLINTLRRVGMNSGKRFKQFLRDQFSNGEMMSEYPDLHIIAAELMSEGAINLNLYNIEIAEAVRRSMSAPFFFTPCYYKCAGKLRCYVDGGVTNNYPIDHFDDHKRLTIGIRLQAQENPRISPLKRMNVKEYGMAIFTTLVESIEREHIDDAHWANTINVNTGNIRSFDFNINKSDRQFLAREGYNCAKAWCEKKEEHDRLLKKAGGK